LHQPSKQQSLLNPPLQRWSRAQHSRFFHQLAIHAIEAATSILAAAAGEILGEKGQLTTLSWFETVVEAITNSPVADLLRDEQVHLAESVAQQVFNFVVNFRGINVYQFSNCLEGL